jgi:DNA-binding cell septation regulator SpoVG
MMAAACVHCSVLVLVNVGGNIEGIAGGIRVRDGERDGHVATPRVRFAESEFVTISRARNEPIRKQISVMVDQIHYH